MSADQLLATLSPEQEKPVFHPVEQPELVLAGAGSGKTRVMTARVHYLLKQDINPRSVVTITFTNKAADELRHRLGFGDDPKVGPRVSTIHSLALNAIRIDPRGFGLATSKVTPLDEGDQKDMLRRLIENRKKDPKFHELDMWKLKEKLGYHRARGVGFAVDYTPEVHKLAEKAHRGYHAMTEAEILLWKDYEKAKTCHPAGTLVDVVARPARFQNRVKGVVPAVVEQRPIEALKDGDQVVTWRRKDGRTLYGGKSVRVASRNYRGDLLTVTLATGEAVPMTPDHYVWVRFNESVAQKYFVYLMYRSDLGFRVGLSCFKRGTGHASGLTGRLADEQGERLWILRVCADRFEATTWEQLFSFKYGIPQTMFCGRYPRYDELIRLVFAEADPTGAYRCLSDLGLLFDEPLIRRGEQAYVHACMRFFKTAAANVLADYMSFPARTRPSWDSGRQHGWRIPEGVPVQQVTRSRHMGPVFSLDVADEHTYVANGVIVANCASVVDFDDMLHLVVRRGQIDDVWRSGIQRQFRHVLMDEAQDTNPVQWQFVEMLLDPNNHSLCAVGDLSQCQPPGTRVSVVVSPPRGSLPAVVETRPIETLQDGDRVVSWDKHVQISHSAGRPIRVAQRPYTGPLVSIVTAHGTTECTPNHWNWVRFNENTQGKHLVYLMHREDLGFRVGISVFKRATTGGRRGAYGLSYRFNQEKADRAWILRVCETRAEAEAWEEIYSVKYGIPESLFEPEPCLNKTSELIRLVFSHANPEGGYRCLAEHDLLWTHPLVDRTTKGTHGNSWRGFFKTAAANVLPGLMDIPIPGRNCSTPITATHRREYVGSVYSLDVERDHTYVADGLVVGNSIYAFNGAAPEILGGMAAGWRGVVPVTYKLEDNYRSLGKVVRFANRIQKTMTGTVPLQMNVKRLEAEGYEGAVTLLREGTDRDIAERIAETIARDARLKTGKFKFRDNAILVRSASQIPALEDALVRCRIPYIVRGGQGLFQTEEARDLFAYLKLVVNPSDVMAFKRAVGTPKRGLGDVAVEKLQKTALTKFDGDLVRAAQNSDHMVLRPFGDFIGDLGRFENPVDALHKLISRIDYRSLIRDRYKKNPEAQERKLENLDRILEAIKGLVESSPNGTASFADIIFRVTMDSKAEAASDDGVAVISTIHNAKGLEWPRVYVTNVYEGSLPHQWSSSEKEVEEERRLFYVAVTRARDVCGLCVPTTVSRGPNVVRVQPSRFLVELGIIQ